MNVSKYWSIRVSINEGDEILMKEIKNWWIKVSNDERD